MQKFYDVGALTTPIFEVGKANGLFMVSKLVNSEARIGAQAVGQLELGAPTLSHYSVCLPGTVTYPRAYICREHAKGIRNCLPSKKIFNLALVISY